MESATKREVIRQLQERILTMQGMTKPGIQRAAIGLGFLESAFPDGVFPTGTIHEMISPGPEEAAATTGFMAALISKLAKRAGFCLWISTRRMLFPPALKLFDIQPEQIIFLDLQRERDVLWAVEEALRCEELIAVVGEIKELDFAQSRRLQLAVEKSQVTGFIHRVQPDLENTVACIARWKISPMPGIIEEGMPGIGSPKWGVELARVRNGKPGSYQLAWVNNEFEHFTNKELQDNIEEDKANYA